MDSQITAENRIHAAAEELRKASLILQERLPSLPDDKKEWLMEWAIRASIASRTLRAQLRNGKA